jgi:hypothetical protein
VAERINRPMQVGLRFTSKEVTFLIDAVSFRIQDYEATLNDPATDNDIRSDIRNDLGLFRETLKYLQKPDHLYVQE